MRKRDNSIIKNVDFTRLNKILNEKGIRRAELSRRCGYDDSQYDRKNVFGRKKLNWTVVNTLERVYGISPDEYCYEKTETVASNNDTAETTASNNDIYKYTVSFNGEFLKKLAFASINKHISIEDFIFDCILEGLKQEEN